MTLWLTFALMTAAAVFAVLWPLRRNRAPVRSGSDLAVYRDQLDEVERDQAAGRIGKAEAEAARVEVSRRLLAAAAGTEKAPTTIDGKPALRRRRAVALAALLLLPVGAGALYLTLGSPAILTEPLAARLNVPAEQRSIEDMVAQVEAHLERNPDDARGWEVLAPIYLQSGRYEDSVKAWRNVLRLQGSNAEREANLGEALIAVANGIVTAEARTAFERAVAIDASTVRGRFYLGLAAEQDGRREEAAKIWRTLIAEAPADAHWVGFVREALARAEGKPETPGPAAEDLEAAAKLAPDQQTAMIRGMVDRLAERLKADGSDLDGWVRLLRSYKVLGETDKALAAAAEARRALAGEPDKLRRLDDAMKAFGFEG